MRYFFILLSVLIFQSSSFSQTSELLYEDEVPLIYRKEASGGVSLHSHGWGIGFNRGKHITGFKKRMLSFEALTMKHPKEFKTKYFEDSKEYVYGKLNSLGVIRSGIGYQRVLYGKGDRAGVEVRLNYTAGLSMGLAKPVYLYIYVPRSGSPVNQPPDIQRYDPEKHYIDNILGQAGFAEGLGQMKFYPGAYGKLGVSFESASYDYDIKAIETGIVIDAWPKAIPIMAFIDNKNVFFGFYLTLLYGGKW